MRTKVDLRATGTRRGRSGDHLRFGRRRAQIDHLPVGQSVRTSGQQHNNHLRTRGWRTLRKEGGRVELERVKLQRRPTPDERPSRWPWVWVVPARSDAHLLLDDLYLPGLGEVLCRSSGSPVPARPTKAGSAPPSPVTDCPARLPADGFPALPPSSSSCPFVCASAPSPGPWARAHPLRSSPRRAGQPRATLDTVGRARQRVQ